MNVSDLYKKIKQILDDCNVALVNKGLNKVGNLYQIYSELNSININRLPYLLSSEIIEVTEDDLKGISFIGDCAFYDCHNLTSVTIPDSVTSIGANVFASCYNLRDIYLNPTAPPSLDALYLPSASTTIHVPIGCGDTYKSATNWSAHADRIVEDIVLQQKEVEG